MECLGDAGDDTDARARCIIEYLSMPVPRSWWETAMETEELSDNHIRILRSLQGELSRLPRLGGHLSTALLITLAFTQNAQTSEPVEPRFVNEALDRAREVLQVRRDLVNLAELIDARGIDEAM